MPPVMKHHPVRLEAPHPSRRFPAEISTEKTAESGQTGGFLRRIRKHQNAYKHTAHIDIELIRIRQGIKLLIQRSIQVKMPLSHTENRFPESFFRQEITHEQE